MKVQLIAVICSDRQAKNITGLRLFDPATKEVKDIVYNAVLQALGANKIVIEGLKIENGELKGSNGALDRYPALYSYKSSLTLVRPGMVILAEIGDKGYRAVDFKGEVRDFTKNELLTMHESSPIANGKVVVKKDGSLIVSAINGTYPVIPVTDKSVKFKKHTISKSIKGNKSNAALKKADADSKEEIQKEVRTAIAKERGIHSIKTISGRPRKNSREKDIDKATGLTVEQKMAYVARTLLECRPFYYAAYKKLNRVEACEEDGINTMAVSLDTLYTNSEFILDRSLSELVFVVLHEISHIAMRHRTRGIGKDHELWNIATDLYINKVLAEEFGLTRRGQRELIVPEGGKRAGDSNFYIALPTVGLYSDKIDTKVDTPESIYFELCSERDKRIIFGPGGDKGDGPTMKVDEIEDPPEIDGGGKGNDSGTNQNKNGQGEEQNKGQGKGQDSKEQPSSSTETRKLPKQEKPKEIKKTFRGVEIGESIGSDIVDDDKSRGLTNDEINQLQRQKQKEIIAEAKLERDKRKLYGDNPGGMERLIQEDKDDPLPWSKLLRKFLTPLGKKEKSYSKINVRYKQACNANVADYVTVDPNALLGVKICIDTSGSVSDEELGKAVFHIKEMLKKYKIVDGEIIYWDATVQAYGTFNNKKEAKAISTNMTGGGGTNAECVFEYFNNEKAYKKNIKPKVKPSLIIMFTDGGFPSPSAEKYKKDYGNKTIWVIYKGNSFTAPFGRVAPYVDPKKGY